MDFKACIDMSLAFVVDQARPTANYKTAAKVVTDQALEMKHTLKMLSSSQYTHHNEQ